MTSSHTKRSTNVTYSARPIPCPVAKLLEPAILAPRSTGQSRRRSGTVRVGPDAFNQPALFLRDGPTTLRRRKVTSAALRAVRIRISALTLQSMHAALRWVSANSPDAWFYDFNELRQLVGSLGNQPRVAAWVDESPGLDIDPELS